MRDCDPDVYNGDARVPAILKPNASMRLPLKLTMIGFAYVAALAIMFDLGAYVKTLELHGLVGFVLLPSILLVEFGILAGVAISLRSGLLKAFQQKRVASQCAFLLAAFSAAFGVSGYVVGIFGVAVFGFGAAALFALIWATGLLLELCSIGCIFVGYLLLPENGCNPPWQVGVHRAYD